jgi:hypothetical protein
VQEGHDVVDLIAVDMNIVKQGVDRPHGRVSPPPGVGRAHEIIQKVRWPTPRRLGVRNAPTRFVSELIVASRAAPLVGSSE